MTQPGSDRRAIGFIGIGKMGAPMAARLVRGGYDVTVFDARPGAAAEFCAAHPGARSSSSLAALAAGSDVVITMLPDSGIVQEVLTASGDAILLALRPRTLVIEMSSGDPVVTRQLAEQCAARQVSMIDAPVSGGVARAVTGELAIMVGGDTADLEAVRELLQVMGKAIHHVGAIGAGQAMKAVNNMASAAGFLIAAEALQIGTRFGLDAERMIDVLNSSSGRNNSTELKFKQFVLSSRFDSGFSIGLMVKDLATAMSLADATHTDARFSAACLERWRSAIDEVGAQADHTEMARAVERWAQRGAN